MVWLFQPRIHRPILGRGFSPSPAARWDCFGVTLSAEDGGYRMALSQPDAQDSVCVFIFARPP